MADYFVSGKKGNGKSLVVVGRIRDALLEGRRVATNLDLNLDQLLPPRRRNVDVIRLPDKPTAHDLIALGEGSSVVDESTYGLIVLDELATWLNARTFQDKTRAGVLDFLVHSRKWGWETYLIGQNINQVDKQIREALIEYEVKCKRLDRLKVPFVGGLIRGLSGGLLSGNFPKVHVASVFYEGVRTDRWWYTGSEFYKAYDTRQKFIASTPDHATNWVPGDLGNRPVGNYALLSPWHLQGRYMRPSIVERFKAWWSGSPRVVRPKSPLMPVPVNLTPDQKWKLARHLATLPTDRAQSLLKLLSERLTGHELRGC